MQLIKFRNFEEFHNYKSIQIDKRLQVESRIAEDIKNKRGFGKVSLKGFCEVCKKASKFKIEDKKFENTQKINFRENVVCPYCGLGNRKRFILSYLEKKLNESKIDSTVYLYEHNTRLFKQAKFFFKDIKLIGSEFRGYDKKPGEMINGVRHEDAANLSFDNNCVDFIVSSDVYEHVQDIHKTLSEAYRVLKKKGTLIISIPFHRKNKETIMRVNLENNTMKHLLPLTYHDDPITRKRDSLVFYDYGWDFLNFLKKVGFDDAYALGYYSMFLGYVGEGLQFIFIASKH